MKILPSISLAALLATVALEARAADLGPVAAPSQAPVTSNGWIVTLSGTVGAGPRYPGSDLFSVFGYPTIDFRRVGEPARFSAPDDGFSLPLFETPSFQIGPTARFREGRFRSDDRAELTGLRKVDWSIEPGVFVEFWFIPTLRARAEIRYGVHGYHDIVGNLALDWVQPYERFTFSLGPRLAFGGSNFTNAYFGVTPAQAAVNGLVTPFNASGGVTSVGALGSVSYKWSDEWTTTAFAGYQRLVGDAGDSPITRRLGSPDQFTVGASVSYSFTFLP